MLFAIDIKSNIVYKKSQEQGFSGIEYKINKEV